MRHASLSDIFTAATQAASPFIQDKTDKLRYQNDLELKNEAARFSTDLRNYTRDNPFDGNFEGYLKKIQEYTGKWYDGAAARNGSAYYQRNIQQMKTRSLEAARDFALEREDAWRAEQEGVSYANDARSYLDAGWDPGVTMDAISNRIALSGTRRQIGPKEAYAMRREAEQALYGKTALDALGAVKDVTKVGEALDMVNAEFKRFMLPESVPLYDAEGREIGSEERPWGFAGKEEFDRKLAREKTGDIFRSAQGAFSRYIVSGDIDGAIAYGKQWGAVLNRFYNPRNTDVYANLSDDQRLQFDGYFDWRRLEEHQKQGGAGKLAAMFGFAPEQFIRARLHGDGTVKLGEDENGRPIVERFETMNEAKERFIELEKQVFGAKHEGGNRVVVANLWEEERSGLLKKFDDAVAAYIRTHIPALGAEYDRFRKFETYITEGTKDKPNEYYSKEMNDLTPEQRDRFAQNCVDFFTDMFWNGIIDSGDTGEIRNMMRDFTRKEAGTILEWKGTPGEEGAKIKQMAEFSARAMSAGAEDAVFTVDRVEDLAGIPGVLPSGTPPDADIRWRSESQREAAEQVREEERKYLALALGLSLEDLQPGWMRSGRRKRDITAKGIFVQGSGADAVTWRMNYDQSANMVPERYNRETETWERDRTVERPQTVSERGESGLRLQREYMQAMREGKHPLTGEPFDYAKEPPPLEPGASAQDRQMRRAAWSRRDYPKLQEWAAYFQRQGR
jgi:hypothetical protein